MPKAHVFTAHGGPEVESLADLLRPAPGPGQLLVAVQPEGLRLVEEGHARGKIVTGVEVA